MGNSKTEIYLSMIVFKLNKIMAFSKPIIFETISKSLKCLPQDSDSPFDVLFK